MTPGEPTAAGRKALVNPLETYRESGSRAARARNNSDEALAKFEAEHFRKMKALETAPNREAADAAYHAGYRAARNVPSKVPA